MFTIGQRRKVEKSSKSSSSNSSLIISTNKILTLIDKIRRGRCRNSTWTKYHQVWRQFNTFIVALDRKPNNWEDRLVLFVGHLANKKMQSGTIKSYISAIRTTLQEINIPLQEDKFLLKSLTKACSINSDKLYICFPIQKKMLCALLDNTNIYFSHRNQPYLAILYQAMFATAYFGLFRIGEVTKSPHVLMAWDVHIASNKNKILFLLHTSKTHNRSHFPQCIKISSERKNHTKNTNAHCPFALIHHYLSVRKNCSQNEQFFVFFDRTPVSAFNF